MNVYSTGRNILDAGVISGLDMTPETTYFNQGYEIIDGWKIQNAEQRSMLYGAISMKTALYWSLNTGSIYALKLLGGDPSSITQAGRENYTTIIIIISVWGKLLELS